MKKFIFVVLIFLSLSFAGSTGISATGKSIVESAFERAAVIHEIERIEYLCIDGQWYEIIYYTDVSRETNPITQPPND